MVAAILLLVAVVIGGLAAARAWAQHATARDLAIRTPDGIQEAGYVGINGVPQWVQVRGEHRANPVILFVHGGPGLAMTPFTPVLKGWERDFTVAQWDQPDAGLTFSRNGAEPLSLARATADGIAVAEHLRTRLPGAPIIVLGHSWGSAVALQMVRQRPDLFAAYVGTGQMSRRNAQEALSYATVLSRLQARGDTKGVAELEASGPPPYRDLAHLLVERKWLAKVDTPAERGLFPRMARVLLTAPGLSLRQVLDFNAAPKAAQPRAYGDIDRFDADAGGQAFAVPMFVFQGEQDLYAPGDINRRWLDEVTAPAKAFVVLPGGGHNAVLTMPDAFLAELKAKVRPLAMGAAH